MHTLQTTWLIDEFQQNLHSKGDYANAIRHVTEVCPELVDYTNKFLLLLAGDYPTWKYNKKLVAEVMFPVNSSALLANI